VFSNVASVARTVWSPIIGIVQNVVSKISTAFSSIASIVRTVWSPIIGIVQNVVGKISTAFSGVASVVRTVWSPIIGIVQNVVGKISTAFSGVASVVRTVWSPIIGVVQNVVGKISTAFSSVASIVRTVWSPIIGVVQNVVGKISTAFSSIASVIRGALSPITSIVQNIIGRIFVTFNNILFPATTILSGLSIIILNSFSNVASVVKSTLSPLIGIVQNIVRNIPLISANISSVIQTTLTSMFGVVQNVVGKILSAFNNAVAGISNFCNVIKNLFSTSFLDLNTIVSGFGNTFNSIFSNFGISLTWLGDQFNQLYSAIAETFDAIVASLGRGDIESAIQVIWASIKLIWLQGVNSLVTTWYWLVETLQEAWAVCIFKISELLASAWFGVQQFWTETVYTMSTLWIGFSDTIISTWKKAEQAIAQGIGYIIAKMQGLDPNEMSNLINDDYEQQARQRESDKNRRLADVQEQRDQKITSLKSEREGTLDVLQQDFAHNSSIRNSAYESKLAAQEQELAAAKAAYNEAINRAKNPVVSDPNKPESLQERLRTKVDDAMRGFKANTNLESKVSVSGSFSAAALQSMGAGSSIDRVAKATEKSEKHLEKLVNKNDKPTKQTSAKKIDDSENENGDNIVVAELKQQTRFLRDISSNSQLKFQ
jgi:phage-related protein